MKNIKLQADLLIKLLFVFIFGLIISMAVTSKFNAHPDEYAHAKAVEYYQNHWLPPAVSNPEIRHTFSGYGNSRLMGFESYYFLNGKFSKLTNYFIKDSLISMRLFNCLLFLILMTIFFKSSPKVKPLFLVLLVSPQIWYLFSYVNSGAFALFLSLILVQQIVYQKSVLNKFLNSPKILAPISGAISIAIILALQVLSKKNYYIILIFFGLLSLGNIFQVKEGQKRLFVKYLTIAGIVLLLVAPRYLYDAKIHGLNRSETIAEYKEEFAENGFKRSQINDTVSHFRIFLKDKGVTFNELFLESKDWHELSYYSFAGMFGYMTISNSFAYYLVMLGLYFAFAIYLTFNSIYKKSPSIKLTALLFYLLFILILLLSMHFSWTSDYQPQGRYLFAILGVLGFWFTKFSELNKTTIFKLFIISIALVSCYSFVFVALLHIPKM